MENTTTKQNTPKDVFLYILNILTFYLSVVGFIILYIQYISALFPDPLNFYYTAVANGVRIATSMFVVAVPIFIITSWLLSKDLKVNPEKREGKLRKWLIYLTLFVSSVTVIVNLIIFVYNFMSGELTIQFFLKILTVLLVALAVFGYYIWELKRKDNGTSRIPKIFAWVISAVVVASIVIGFFVIGSPAEQRARRFDEQRVSDLQVLQSQIVNYWIQKQALPASLNNLEDSISGFIIPRDPDSYASYEYAVQSPLSFELCATFKTSTKDFKVAYKGSRAFYTEPMSYGSFQQNWDHEAERTCFTRTIDPELYKPKTLPAL